MSGGHIDTSVILEAKDIKMDFKVGQGIVHSLKQVSFSLQANSFNIIYGPSGSGKSTLLNIIGGMQAPTSGTLKIQDEYIYDLEADKLADFRASKIGFLHQTNYWIKSLDVIDNISVPLYAQGFSKEKAKNLALNSLDRVGMREYATKMPSLLSGGEQQRLAMARALVNDPLFIIADEPTGNLDTTNGDMILELLLNLQTEFRRTIILVTHNLEYISFADHLVRISDGNVEDIAKQEMAGITEELLQKTKQRISKLERVKQDASKVR